MATNTSNTGWKIHADEQRRAWLSLTHAQRLAWLWSAKMFAAQALGAAKRAPIHYADEKSSADQ